MIVAGLAGGAPPLAAPSRLEPRLELLDQATGAGRTPIRVGIEAAAQDGGGRRGGMWPGLSQVRRRLRSGATEGLGRGGAALGPLPAEDLEGDRGQRIDVGRRPAGLPVEALRGDVAQRAENVVGGGDPADVSGGRHPQVAELHDAVVADQDVGGLHVAVDHPAEMRVVEAAGDLPQDPDRLVRLHGPGRDQPRERLAGHVLHHDQHPVRPGERVVDGDDVRMVERRPELGLALEALGAALRGGSMHPLHGHLPGQHRSSARNTVAIPPWPRRSMTR